MSQRDVGAGEERRALTALDHLLDEQPTEFQVKLLRLAREFHWDENDPGFAVPLATAQLERVLAVYPAQIQRVLGQLSQEQRADWGRVQEAMKATVLRSEQIAERSERRLGEVKGLLSLELVQVTGRVQQECLAMHRRMGEERKLLKQELTWAADALKADVAREREATVQMLDEERRAAVRMLNEEREAVAQLLRDEREAMSADAKRLSEQLQQETRAQTQAIIAEGVVASQQRADGQVMQIVRGVRAKHFWETMAVALITALCLMVVGWFAGLLLGRQPQLMSDLNVIRRQAAVQREETRWLLEKANRAECFYGLKQQSDPQCQE